MNARACFCVCVCVSVCPSVCLSRARDTSLKLLWYGNNSNFRPFSIILVADRWRLGLGLPKKRASNLLFSRRIVVPTDTPFLKHEMFALNASRLAHPSKRRIRHANSFSLDDKARNASVLLPSANTQQYRVDKPSVQTCPKTTRGRMKCN